MSLKIPKSVCDPNLNQDDSDGLSEMEDSSSSSDEEEESENAETEDVENGKQATKSKSEKKKPNGKSMLPVDDKPSVSLGGLDLIRKDFSKKHYFSLESRPVVSPRENRRFVTKKGIVQIERSHVAQRGRRYIADFFNTMLDIQWRYVLLIFTLSFFLSWLGFAGVWYAIAYLRGDLEPEHLPDMQEETKWQPCVLAIYNFASAFLFSVETQHTIGYGTRQTTERCPEAIFLQSLQSVVGVIIQACLVGTFFAKLSRPKKRAQTLLFTKNAVVCIRDGSLCLLFRVGNMRCSQLVESHVRAILVSKKVTDEGEIIPYHPTELKVGVDIEGEVDNILFLWPATVIHKIDEESPFYHLNAQEMVKKRYEIIVTLEGIVEPSGMSIQARSSYMPDEILWGYRFVNVMKYNKSSGQYNIDYASFNSVYKIDIPTISSKDMDSEKKKLKKKNKEVKAKDDQTAVKDAVDEKERKVTDVRPFGSSPNLMTTYVPQPYPFYYQPYLSARPPTLSTPLLWPPPQHPPHSGFQNPSPLPSRYTNRRRMMNTESSSPGPNLFHVRPQDHQESKTPREPSTERQYWIV